ncbi:MAG: energy transducer TonB [Ignavibacteriaceae bacterium]|nr:energy transducer TonB [Ignavibacteriaceae bacterium]
MRYTKWVIGIVFIIFNLIIMADSAYCQEDPYLPFAEVMPAPVGGMKAIYEKIIYPEIAKSNGIKGKVYLLVFINENGTIDEVKVLKGIGGGCNEAAISGVKSVRFSAGKNNGKPVKTKLSLAINF